MTDRRIQWAATTYSLGSPIPDNLLRVAIVPCDAMTPENVLSVELNYGVPQKWQRPVAAIPFASAALAPQNMLRASDCAAVPVSGITADGGQLIYSDLGGLVVV